MARRSTWQRLMESTEGPTVTVQIPRMWAEELLRSLATALEMDDGMGMGDEMGGDIDMEPHMEPDGDDVGGAPDFDLDDMFGGGDEEGGEEKPEPPAGDSDDDDDSDDEPDEDEEEDDDDEEEQDEAADYSKSGGNPSGLRTQTAFGEMFRRPGRKPLSEGRRPSPRRGRR